MLFYRFFRLLANSKAGSSQWIRFKGPGLQPQPTDAKAFPSLPVPIPSVARMLRTLLSTNSQRLHKFPRIRLTMSLCPAATCYITAYERNMSICRESSRTLRNLQYIIFGLLRIRPSTALAIPGRPGARVSCEARRPPPKLAANVCLNLGF